MAAGACRVPIAPQGGNAVEAAESSGGMTTSRNRARCRSARAGALLAALCVLAGCHDSSGVLELVGSVERTQVEMVAPVSETIAAIPVRRGERVEAGQTLLRLDATLARAEEARVEAELAGARTSNRVAAQDLSRFQRLRRQRVASEQDLERAELKRDEATARLRAAEAGLEAARKRLRDLELVAPTSGVVDQLPYEMGERVPAGAVLVVLLSDDAPWVRVWVPESSVVHVQPGGPAEITIDGIGSADAPRVMGGRVLDVAREPGFTPHYALTERERVHLVYEARIEISDAPQSLRPGLPATVHIALTPALLPLDADRDDRVAR